VGKKLIINAIGSAESHSEETTFSLEKHQREGGNRKKENQVLSKAAHRKVQLAKEEAGGKLCVRLEKKKILSGTGGRNEESKAQWNIRKKSYKKGGETPRWPFKVKKKLLLEDVFPRKLLGRP